MEYRDEIIDNANDIINKYPSKMQLGDKLKNIICDLRCYAYMKNIDWQDCLDYAERHFSWDKSLFEELKKDV
jgi:hypothetical protein